MAGDVAVVLFPGSNCENDVVEALGWVGGKGRIVWHGDRDLRDPDAVVLPGGFAHGDYLRPGAIARFSPIMEAVMGFARDGGPVVGICNGFQILTEAGLLPGALQKNRGLKFLCGMATVEVRTVRTPITQLAQVGDRLRLPINHFEGNYTCDGPTLERLSAEDRIVLTYLDNPNGSVGNIAGVCNEARNVVGLMPHPERAGHPLLGSGDGEVLLRSLTQAGRGSLSPSG